ncbi:hypothetical protein AMJ57_05210 [Parcubacteria bacterium SG8_24]|nr:MAG: hypothetical protein AMJ57_05210 [Parcubacteria bacterium SG8_24]
MTKDRNVIGVDVGATKIYAALVTPTGRIVRDARVPTETRRGARRILENIEEAIRRIDDRKVKAIGLGLAGQVDFRKGIFVEGPNFPKSFRKIPIVRHLSRSFSRRCVADNDAHCFTLGEAIHGAGKRCDTVFGVTLGTGIGGGLVIDREVYRGRDNTAGEIGHTVIGLCTEGTCGCGRDGHFESFSSGTGMVNRYREATGRSLRPSDIVRRALRDRAARETLELAAYSLAVGFANIIHAFNPDAIIIGGGLSRTAPLFASFRRELRRQLIYPALKDTPVISSRLGERANAIGAAHLAAAGAGGR